ncbi:uncharacterized protein cfap92 isoform X2 [Hypanus sabinus]|uniref:uncharacterized protein cfap92 isoform X2 n=1 Tax=Hypanus sabinus TaxID=79690 RepID=UPI0028C3B198|nr:uncharacterized protein cfap92 isoform X2 [Hypanus sabinus]
MSRPAECSGARSVLSKPELPAPSNLAVQLICELLQYPAEGFAERPVAARREELCLSPSNQKLESNLRWEHLSPGEDKQWSSGIGGPVPQRRARRARMATGTCIRRDGSEELHFPDSISTELAPSLLGRGTTMDGESGASTSGDDTTGGASDYGQTLATPAPATEPNNAEQSSGVSEVANDFQAEDTAEPVPHLVTFTVTVTLAVPTENNKMKDQKYKALKMLEALKAISYFHMEASLLPNAEPIKFDLVTFEKAAKLYMASDSQVLKPWIEDERRWLLFRHNVELPVTKELILTLVPHRMTLRIWEGKDKVSPKAKFDHPKNLHHPSDTEEASSGSIKYLVKDQLELLENSPLLTTYKATDDLPPETMNFPAQGTVSTLSIHDTEVTTLNEQLQRKLCADMKPKKLMQNVKRLSSVWMLTKGSSHQKGIEATTKKQGMIRIIPPKIHHKKKKVREKPVPALINLDIKLLLAGEKSVTNKLEKIIPGLLDALFTVSVDKSLMSKEVEKELNPMVIRIISASSMPSTPVPIHILQERCGPVYCQYQLFDLPCHQTKGREHGADVSFKDVNLILTGTIDPDKLREYFHGPPLVIEVHDRDRKPKAQAQPPALFGTEPEDSKLSNIGLVSNKRTVHDPFVDADKAWDPYGIAKLNFSELVYGETCLNLALSIQNSSLPDPIGYQRDGLGRRILGVAGAVDGPEGRPLPKGHYLESNSMLHVRVQLAYPLSRRGESSLNEECQFGRIIYIFDYNNRTFLHSLLEQVSSINSLALHLDSQSSGKGSEDGSVDAELQPDSEPKPSSNLDSVSIYNVHAGSVSNLNVVTGFHVMDGIIHLFVLEGLKNKGLRALWEKLPIRSVAGEEGVKVLYNSDLSFHQRLYANLDDYIYHLYLHEPLSNIIKQPLLYVRDMAPQDCFQALHRLQCICSAKKLREVVQGDLFPTAAMIMVLSREFGIPASETDPHNVKDSATIPTLHISKAAPLKRSLYSQLDIYNDKYIQSKLHQTTHTNHIQSNIDAIHEASKKLKEIKPRPLKVVPSEGTKVHNYSIQTFNSTEQAKELLREELAKRPKQRFTYSQTFLWGTLAPVDIVNEEKRIKKRSKETWLTFDGFRFSGFRSSQEANEHPKKPDEARIDELKKPWKENVLNENLNAMLKYRERWKWSERHKDFELYKKVQAAPAPVSIHLAGDTLRAEQLESIHKDYENWHKKLKPYRDTTNPMLPSTRLEAKLELDNCVTVCLKPAIFQKHVLK